MTTANRPSDNRERERMVDKCCTGSTAPRDPSLQELLGRINDKAIQVRNFAESIRDRVAPPVPVPTPQLDPPEQAQLDLTTVARDIQNRLDDAIRRFDEITGLIYG